VYEEKMFPSPGFRPLLVLALFFAGAFALEAKMLVVFGEATETRDPAEGWRFQWNPTGAIGDPANYKDLEPLVAADQRGVNLQGRGVLDDQGGLSADAPSISRFGNVSAIRNNDETPRYAIVSYTLPAASEGDVWVQNGNLHNRSFPDGTALKIYVNDQLVSEALAKQDRLPTLFQQNLGPLGKGDTVVVAVGPGDNGKRGGGKLAFTLEEYPKDSTPPPPQNIYWHSIDAMVPQFTSAGSSATYEFSNRAAMDQMVARESQLVFLGDSITSRWPQELLEQHFAEYRPANLGAGGDRVQNVRWRVREGRLKEAPVQLAVILIGTNNLSNQATVEEIAEGVKLLLDDVRKDLPQAKILLQGVLPRGASLDDPINKTIQSLNAKLSSLADNETVFFQDFGPSLVEPDGSISPEVMPDRLHVAMPGFLRWMEAMKPTLERLLTSHPLKKTAD